MNAVQQQEKTLETRVSLLERIADDMAKLATDHEKRLRWIERVVLYAMGTVGIGGFLLNVFDHLKH